MTPDEYLRNVGFWLNDLPWGMRRDLLSELRAHLDELPAGTDLRAELGPPEKYAGDLRSAAGLERRRGPIAFLGAR
ncbi:MAG: HAAS signaling domain-containing protein, partial [Gaiellaceae bacterium]